MSENQPRRENHDFEAAVQQLLTDNDFKLDPITRMGIVIRAVCDIIHQLGLPLDVVTDTVSNRLQYLKDPQPSLEIDVTMVCTNALVRLPPPEQLEVVTSLVRGVFHHIHPEQHRDAIGVLLTSIGLVRIDLPVEEPEEVTH